VCRWRSAEGGDSGAEAARVGVKGWLQTAQVLVIQVRLQAAVWYSCFCLLLFMIKANQHELACCEALYVVLCCAECLNGSHVLNGQHVQAYQLLVWAVWSRDAMPRVNGKHTLHCTHTKQDALMLDCVMCLQGRCAVVPCAIIASVPASTCELSLQP